jgi:hypothetical protein
MAFPDKPPIRVERIFTSDGAYVPSNGAWRSMYNSSEPRIEISKEAAIRANGCAWLPETGEQPRGGVAPDHTRSNSKTAEARIWATAPVSRTRSGPATSNHRPDPHLSLRFANFVGSKPPDLPAPLT